MLGNQPHPTMQKTIELLKSWGVDVKVMAGSERNGRPYDFDPQYVIRHHTGSALSATENAEINYIMRGGSTPPWAQVLTARDGTINITCQGRANHAGLGGPYMTMPKDSGNRYSVGQEVSNAGGTEVYSLKTLTNARLFDAAFLIACGYKDAGRLLGHKEWAPRRKVDPVYDMDAERRLVTAIMQEKLNPKPVEPAIEVSSYVVKSGDTLSYIASKLKLKLANLIKYNNLKDPNVITPGQVLKTSFSYTVEAGDTLGRIATKFNVDLDAVVQVNKIKNKNIISVGQVLVIPF